MPTPKDVLPEICPKCGSENMIEDNGLCCQDCGWIESDGEDFDEEDYPT